MRKARIKQVEVGKWELTESVGSFLRFALRESNFSNALFKVTIVDGGEVETGFGSRRD